LTHYKKGFYSPPPKPIFVPGLQWIGLLLLSRHEQQGPPLLAAMRWWSSRGGRASFKRDEEAKLLLTCVAQWGRRVVHVFDQGFVGGLWLGLLLALNVRFVLRWRKDYQLVDAQGNKRKAWHIARGKRGSAERLIWDSRRNRWVQASVLVLSVQHPEQPNVTLSLVVCRSAGRLPWYLLTNEAVTNEDEAWRVVFAYVRRWNIEQTWRYEKSELADHQPTPLALAGTREALADGFAGLCLFTNAFRAVLRPVACVAAAHVLSPHRLALPHGQSPALSAAQCPLPALAEASAQLCSAGATTSAQRARARWVRAPRQAVTPCLHSSRMGPIPAVARSRRAAFSHPVLFWSGDEEKLAFSLVSLRR
jgi:hypothetical protein